MITIQSLFPWLYILGHNHEEKVIEYWSRARWAPILGRIINLDIRREVAKLNTFLKRVFPNPREEDRLLWRWNRLGLFSVRSTYWVWGCLMVQTGRLGVLSLGFSFGWLPRMLFSFGTTYEEKAWQGLDRWRHCCLDNEATPLPILQLCHKLLPQMHLYTWHYNWYEHSILHLAQNRSGLEGVVLRSNIPYSQLSAGTYGRNKK